MCTPLVIRAADASDTDAIWRVHTTAIRETCSTHYLPEVIDTWVDHLKPASYLAVVRRGIVVVAEEKETLVGFAHLDVATGEVPSLYVLPDAQRKGVGAALLAAVERTARQNGVETLTLHSTLNAAEFYEARGWTRGAHDVRKITEEVALASVTMQKNLRS